MSEEKQNKYFLMFLIIAMSLVIGMAFGTCVEKAHQSEPKPVERETVYVVEQSPDLELRDESKEPVLKTLEDSIHEFEDGF